MYNKFLKMLCIAGMTANLLQNPMQATVLNADTTIPADTLVKSCLIGAGLYVGYNYLIRKDFLVQSKNPMAYAWFQSVQAKYPGVFDEINFVQKPANSLIPNLLAKFAKGLNWTRHENRIYLKEESLKEIGLIYNKIVDGHPLHDTEALALARYEFVLLHEAGHLAHQDAQSLIVSIIGLLGAVYGAEYIYQQLAQPVVPADSSFAQATADKPAKDKAATECTNKEDKNIVAGYEMPQAKTYLGQTGATVATTLLDTLGLPSQVPGVLATAKGTAFIAGLVALLRHQEAQADAFACQNADTSTLQAALAIFENDETDILFELETKTVDAYIPATSVHENIVQTIMQPIEYIALYGAQQFYLLFKKTAATRWIFDFTQNALNQGPSVRAQTIKDEIARRQNEQA